MSRQSASAPADSAARDLHEIGLGSAGPADQSDNLLMKLHLLLRGRYPWAIGLAVILISVGGWLGYRLVDPFYSAAAKITVHPRVTFVIHATDKTRTPPNFEGYLTTQENKIRTVRVAHIALQSLEGNAEWQQTRPEGKAETDGEFVGRIGASRRSKESEISISFTDADPRAAELAVKAVVDAYMEVYNQDEKIIELNRLDRLQSERDEKEFELKSVRNRIDDIAGESGVDGLRLRHNKHINLLMDAETAFKDARARVKQAEEILESGVQDETVVPSFEQIALQDPQMRGYLKQERDAAADLQTLHLTFGPNHRRIRDQQLTLASLRVRIARRAAEYVRMLEEAPATGGQAIYRKVTPDVLEQWRKEMELAKETMETIKQETSAINDKVRTVDNLMAEMATTMDLLDRADSEIEKVNTEAELITNRIEPLAFEAARVANRGKRMQMAVLLAFAGLLLGVGPVMLIGAMDQRLSSTEDVRWRMGQVPMLGVLPSLPQDLADVEQASIAAHSVHYVRTLLQIGEGADGGRALAVTSPSPGDGKTSLTLALGLSYAAAGSRTLLIDGDLVGAGLTARIDTIVRQKIGRILVNEGLISDQQLNAALDVARTDARRLGEVMLEMGYVNQSDLDKALDLQERSNVGLVDALRGEELTDCAAATGVDGLWILPAGQTGPVHAAKLSPESVRGLLEQARRQFDIVLVDTGPMPGGLEASIFGSTVDGVVLAVSRGAQRAVVDRAVNQLASIGAHVAGIVFNRAEPEDILRSGYTSSVSYLAVGERRQVATGDGERGAGRYGPVAHAVASSRSGDNNGNESDEQA